MYLFLILLFIQTQRIFQHQCNHPIVDLKIGSVLLSSGDVLQRNTRQVNSLRIYKHYDRSFETMTDSETVKTQIITPAIAYWSSTLTAKKPVQGNLFIPRSCVGNTRIVRLANNKTIQVCETECASRMFCFHAEVPEEFIGPCYKVTGTNNYTTITNAKGTGVPNTDLLVLITHLSASCGTATLAYATACVLEDELNRPILGMINACPGKLSTSPTLIQRATQVFKHEFAHILGFSVSLFAFFRDGNGNPLTARDASGLPKSTVHYGESQIYKPDSSTMIEKAYQMQYGGGVVVPTTIALLVTPAVKTEVQRFFNCSDIEGAFLEDYGTKTNALSHFDKRVFQSELMTALVSINPKLSRFTLALMNDTGWYIADFSKAESFDTAQNKGCSFINSTCYSYMLANANPEPYCKEIYGASFSKCSTDNKEVEYCPLRNSPSTAASISNLYKYFTNKDLIYPEPFSDYCPSYQTWSFYDNTGMIFDGVCTDAANNFIKNTKYDYINQEFGSTSKCIPMDSSSVWNIYSCGTSYLYSGYGAGCYQVQCSSVYGLVIVVNGLSYQCKDAGTKIDVTSKNSFYIPSGSLICPSCSTFCSASICNKVSTSLAVPCNNYNRLCPGGSKVSIPCTSSALFSSKLQYSFGLIIYCFIKNYLLL